MLRRLRNLRVPSPHARAVALTVAAVVLVAAMIAAFFGASRGRVFIPLAMARVL